MLRNPIYYLLETEQKCIDDLKPTLKKTHDGKSYTLIALKQDEKSTLHVNNRHYTQEKHHLSIYEKFSEKDPYLSPLHYTADYSTATHDAITVHLYFDEAGDFLDCQIKNNDLEKATIPIEENEKQAIQILTEPYISSQLQYLFQHLFAAQELARENKNTALSDLEKESHKGTTSLTYQRLLEQAIATVNKDNRLTFQPNEDIEKFLQRYLSTLKKKPKKKKKKKHLKPSVSSQEVIAETTPTSDSKLLVDEKKSQPKSTPQSVPNTLMDKEKDLYQQLDKVSPNNITTLFKISKQLDDLEELRTQTLIQACIEGKKETVVRYLREKDFRSNLALLATCIYHNQPLIFDYIYKNGSVKSLVRSFSAYPFITSDPITILTNASSFLQIAYKQNHLSFFLELLNKYHCTPDIAGSLDGLPLLHVIIGEKKNIAYAEALLKAGANPNLTTTRLMLEKPSKEIRKYLSEAKTNRTGTALHVAAFFGNEEAVNLLMEYKVDFTLKDSTHVTPFGAALAPKDFVLNKNIIKTFLQKGHGIDEYQGNPPGTALYRACSTGKLEAVKTLLELKANPSAEHKIYPLIKNCPTFYIVTTPLVCAVQKGFINIVKELLEHPIPENEISTAIKRCESIEIETVLKEALKKPNKEKTVSH